VKSIKERLESGPAPGRQEVKEMCQREEEEETSNESSSRSMGPTQSSWETCSDEEEEMKSSPVSLSRKRFVFIQ
jgi:hypothetical protein